MAVAMVCVTAGAQFGPASSLPATAPTTAASQVAPLTGTGVQAGAVNRAQRAEVRYENGLISVNASNSSLNQILREISRQTGMKITGGVRDERVFGHYGPATPDVILETLIDSNQTNMLLRHTGENVPQELILTPRGGGASPPNPNADPDEDERVQQAGPQQVPAQQAPPIQVQPAQVQPERRVGSPWGGVSQPDATGTALTPNPGSVPPSIPQPANNVLGDPTNVSPSASTLPVADSVSADSIPTPSTTTQVNQGIVDAPNPGGATPNGVKTPEDIYQQLMKLRQQQTAPK